MADLIGQTLGKYQILDRLGRGGMADVYKGYQPGLDRYVAVKVMHAHLSEDPDFITRFRREAKSVAELRHPNIVQVFDFDVQGDVYYMVMEYIEGGETLKQRLQKLAEQGQRLPVEQTLDILIKLADALAYAHDKGMIHRDIKPANVLAPSLDRPVLSDFGIARLIGETGLTASGAMIGTPAYMSPEQGRGERGDARSDIYSLGIVLYEMLTGKPPYDADTPFAIILKHINDPLTPPHLLVDPMPEVVERIVLKCLAKEPADRYASMAELREALRGAQNAIGLQKTTSTIAAAAATLPPITPSAEAARLGPSEPPPQAPATRSGGVKPGWLIGGAVGAIALVIIAIVLITAPRPVAPPPTVAPSPSLPAINAQGSQPTSAPPSVATKVDTPPAAASATVTQLVDQGYRQLFSGDTDAAAESFKPAMIAEPDNPHALVGRALVELDRYGNFDAAAADLDRAGQAIPDDPVLHLARGLLHLRSDKHHDLKLAKSELTTAVDTCGDQQLVCSEVYLERGKARAWDMNDPQGALEDFKHVAQLSSDPHFQADVYSYQANVHYESLGDLATALEELQHAYQLNPWHGYLETGAEYAVRSKEYDKALALYDQLLKAQAGDPQLLVGRAYVEWASGDAGKAQQSASRALQLDPNLLGARYVKGLALLTAGKPEEALGELQPLSVETNTEALDQMSSPFLNHNFGHEIYYDLARAAQAAGDLKTAQNYVTQSLQRDNGWAQPYVLLAELLKESGDLAGARENYLAALDYANDDAGLKAAIEKALVNLSQ